MTSPSGLSWNLTSSSGSSSGSGPSSSSRLRAAPALDQFYRSILESSETGIAVLDETGLAIYLNAAAQRLLGPQLLSAPEVVRQLQPMLAQVQSTLRQTSCTWTIDDRQLSALVRSLAAGSNLTVLELSAPHPVQAANPTEALSHRLKLRPADARLLTLLWRGLRNEEIAAALEAPVGTVKSRIFRLYKRIGARNRAAAVLTAAEILSGR